MQKDQVNNNWYWYLTGEKRGTLSKRFQLYMDLTQLISGILPGRPRCFECNVPLGGFGSKLALSKPSRFSPRLCNFCEKTILKHEGGAEVELSMLFADVRGSTTLAEATETIEFQRLIQRFYRAATKVLVDYNAMVNRLMGDQVIGLFVPRFAGQRHARVAIEAALDLLRATGHSDPQGAWVPVGIGVHTGLAYVGAVGSKEGVQEIAVLGSAPNLAARLSSKAADGEILISEAALASAGISRQELENRRFELKGINEPVLAHVLRLGLSQMPAA
jgi:adenylate cyclase